MLRELIVTGHAREQRTSQSLTRFQAIPGSNWTPEGKVLEKQPFTVRLRMRTFTAIVERDPETGLFVGYVPGFPGAHSQGESLDELNRNLREVVGMLLEDGEPRLEAEFIGTQTVSA